MEWPDIDVATIVLAISTIVLVIVTGYYAKQTKNTVKVLEKTAELSIQPHLKGTFQQIGPVAGTLMIKNIGNGPAKQIELSYKMEGNDETKRDWTKPLMMSNESDEFFIPTSETGKQIEIDYFKNNQTTIRIVGKYFDILGKEHQIDDAIDITAYVKQWEKTTVRYQESAEIRMARDLEKISSSIDSIENTLRKNNRT